ncbi:MAG: bifunctional metallophosphatase/5'-nucleotidase, partial [Proteobacteria bacterium]
MLFSSLLVAGLLSTSSVQAATCSESRLTIIGTNDIHGSVEPKKFMLGKNPPLPKSLGGMPMLSGIVSSIRKSAQLKSECDGVILVDGGDQFQGTLLSNFSEGQLVFDLMSEAGYD